MKQKIAAAIYLSLFTTAIYGQGVKMSTFNIASSIDTGKMRFVVVYDAGGSYLNQQVRMGTFINFLANAVSSGISMGYGIDYTGLNIKVDSATVFPHALHSLAAGYGLSYSGRTFKEDTGVTFQKLASTLSAGYGLNYSGRTYTVDTNSVTSKESRQKGLDSVHVLMTSYYKDSTWANATTSFTPTTLVTNKLYTVSYNITAQAGPLLISNSTSSWANGQILMFYIKGTASRALTYDSDYVAGTDVALPSSTTGTKTLILEFQKNANDGKMYLIGKADGF